MVTVRYTDMPASRIGNRPDFGLLTERIVEHVMHTVS
jgi:hypothetical protein